MWSLHLAEGKDILISLIYICQRKIKLNLQRYLLFNKAGEKAIYKDRKPKREFQLEFAFFPLISCCFLTLSSFSLSTSAQAERYKILLHFFMPLPTAFASC